MTNSSNGVGINLEDLEAPPGLAREQGQQPDHLEIDEVDESDVSLSFFFFRSLYYLLQPSSTTGYLWVPHLPTLASSVPTLGIR